MNNNKRQGSWIIRLILALCIFGSIGLMYYVNIVQKDYVVFTNPDGPERDE